MKIWIKNKKDIINPNLNIFYKIITWMREKLILNFMGVFFLALGIISIVNTLYMGFVFNAGLANILWFCYVAMILLGIGILRRDKFIVVSQISILAIPLLFWNIDFFYFIINGRSLFNIVDYFFIPGISLGKIISLQHLLTIPLAGYAIYLMKLDTKESWKIGVAELFILFFITRLMTNPIENVNCVFENCANFDFGFYYPLQWFIAMFLMVYVTNWVIVKLFYKESKTKAL